MVVSHVYPSKEKIGTTSSHMVPDCCTCIFFLLLCVFLMFLIFFLGFFMYDIFYLCQMWQSFSLTLVIDNVGSFLREQGSVGNANV